ncbi:MAG: hypothetical protein KAX18_15090 [Candidatus Lokiarchaeota archaeon]|nr:hypothetical protein [Candidatus Lokiarchaeota archaeon]
MTLQSAKQRMIKDIKNEDERVQITGYVRDLVEEENFVLNDNTGEIVADIKNIDFGFKENDLINVIGDLVKEGNEIKTIKAEIIQDKNKLNFEYYKKLYELKIKYG